ncbi:sigma-70 family RNA polymerase sigma factor [Mycetocola lacteus]|uniref:sigma-70 family RNA polymerase sigma factor n=1 Tax=Mycetocola lacteus TaxID=76637 RepID=UPI001FE33F91|nr:sigma-70 family RNA polymerase sigma factor [Mycetocola lacteus]
MGTGECTISPLSAENPPPHSVAQPSSPTQGSPLNSEQPAPDDSELLRAARAGEEGAFATLWTRHAEAGKRASRAISRSFDADDVVSEAFSRIIATVNRGSGPQDAFRPYLFATIRSVIARWGGRQHEVNVDQLEVVGDLSADMTSKEFERQLIVRAFATLPTRWQEVLWYVEVEGKRPRQIAPLIGVSANSVSALAYRAREGLRQAWIQEHFAILPAESEHRWVVQRIGEYSRDALSTRDRARFDTHIDQCDSCRALVVEGRELAGSLRVWLLPALIGTGAAAYLAGNSSSSAVAAVAALRHSKPAMTITATATAGALVAAGIIGVALLPKASPPPAQSAARPGTTAPLVPSGPVTPQPEQPEQPVSEDADPGITLLPGITATPSADAPRVPEISSPSPSVLPTPQPSTSAPTPATPEAPRITRVDDGGGLLWPILSGTAEPEAAVHLTGPGVDATVLADDSGRWHTAPLELPAGFSQLRVDQSVEDETSPETTQTILLTTPERPTVRWDPVYGITAIIRSQPGAPAVLTIDPLGTRPITGGTDGVTETPINIPATLSRVVLSAHYEQGERRGPTSAATVVITQ